MKSLIVVKLSKASCIKVIKKKKKKEKREKERQRLIETPSAACSACRTGACSAGLRAGGAGGEWGQLVGEGPFGVPCGGTGCRVLPRHHPCVRVVRSCQRTWTARGVLADAASPPGSACAPEDAGEGQACLAG